MNCTLEAVEDVFFTSLGDFKGSVVVVSANFALSHILFSFRDSIPLMRASDVPEDSVL